MPCAWSYRWRREGLTHFCTRFFFRRGPVPSPFRPDKTRTAMGQAIES